MSEHPQTDAGSTAPERDEATYDPGAMEAKWRGVWDRLELFVAER